MKSDGILPGMRELHGYTVMRTDELSRLKKEVLFFDKVHIGRESGTSLEADANFDFLFERGVLADFEEDEYPLKDFTRCGEFENFDELRDAAAGLYPWWGDEKEYLQVSQDRFLCVLEYMMRANLGCPLGPTTHFDKVAIRLMHSPKPFSQNTTPAPPQNLNKVLDVAIEMIPVPVDETPWEAILDFRSELHMKRWTLRRWLRSLAANAKASESELKDEIEFTLNEYSEAMKLYRIKYRMSSLDVFLVSPLEIIENVVKFNWSKIARGALSLQKRKLDLMEAEMTAPGHEAAYLYDARQRFSR